MKWPNKKYKIGENHLCRSFFLSRRFRRCDLSGRCRYPWDWKKSHRFHRFTQIFLGTFFFVTQISQMTQIFSHGIFFHRMPRNLFGGFLLRRLLTDFRRCDLSGRCRYPLRLDKEIHQRFHRKSVYICEICGTKPSNEEKSASSAKSAWQKTTGAYIGREPLASGQSSAKIRE